MHIVIFHTIKFTNANIISFKEFSVLMHNIEGRWLFMMLQLNLITITSITTWHHELYLMGKTVLQFLRFYKVDLSLTAFWNWSLKSPEYGKMRNVQREA